VTTNLLIAYPDVPWEFGTVTADPVAEDGYGAENVVTGARGDRFLSSAEDTEHEVRFQGAAERSTDYVFIARADLIANAGTVRLRVQVSDDGSSWGTAVDENPLTTADLSGNNSEDYFTAIEGAGSWDFIRVYVTSASPFTFTFSKFYAGSLFDFGRDPVYEIARSSAVYTPKDRRARRVYTLTWKGITDAKRADFIDKILQYRDVNPVVLYDANDLIFEGLTTLHARIVSSTIKTIWNNNNEIVLTLEELI